MCSTGGNGRATSTPLVARLALGAIRTTNQGALSLESGLRPAPAHWTTASGASPSGSPAYQGATKPGNSSEPRTACSANDSRCWNGREETVLLEVATPLEESTTIEEEAAAMREAQLSGRLGLNIFTDGSRLENGATGYAAAWKKVDTWKGHKTHMG